MSGAVRVEVTGGEPSPEETAALVAVLEFLLASPRAVPGWEAPASSEWALQGRMAELHWEPLSQRWPGEPPGRSWRRVLT